jgi:hypothetical protein
MVSGIVAAAPPIEILDFATTPTVGPTWGGPELVKSLNYEETNTQKIKNFLSNETPLSSATILRLHLTTSLAGEQGRLIALQCKTLHPQHPWKQVDCLATSLVATFRKYGFASMTTPCQSFAYGFAKGFDEFKFPHSGVFYKVQYGSNENHIFNFFVITDHSGNPYSYVIDVMLAPQTIFPFTQRTESFRNLVGSDQLPAIEFKGK